MLTENLDQPSFLCARMRGAILFIFVCFSVVIHAQTFTSTSSYFANAQQSGLTVQQEPAYRSYQSTIYEPFAAGMSRSADSDTYGNGASRISGRKNTWGGDGMGDEEGDDAGHRDNNSPVGDAWSMLLFAAVAAFVVAKKQKAMEVIENKN